MTRVVVVGAGVAGLAAAVHLAQRGAEVTVVAKGAGGLHLSPGTIDVLGYAPERVDATAPAVQALAAAHPDHPYASLAPGLPGAMAWIREIAAPLGYEGDDGRNMLLPTAVGVARPTALAPAPMAVARLSGQVRLVAVGLAALKDFFPGLLAENLPRADLPDGVSVSARAVTADWSPRPGQAEVVAPLFARALDDPQARRALAQTLRPLVEPGETVALPAVIGLADPVAAWTDLQDLLGTPVAEIATIPPSVPGMRLQRRLTGLLRGAGGDLVLGPPAVGVEGAHGRASAVLVRDAARTRRMEADAVVLATGGFAAGGIALDSHGNLTETVAGLPVAGPVAGAPSLAPRHLDPQPLLRAGLVVDDAMRPVDPGGTAVWANVHAIGDLVAGAEPWREKSGEGIAITGALRAASAILEET